MAERKTNSRTSQSEANRRTSPPKNEGKQESPNQAAPYKKPKENLVKVVFHAYVPEQTAQVKRPVYLTGNLSLVNNKFADWEMPGQKMKKVDSNHWTLTLKIPENATFEYKYTLGDWDHVERDIYCNEVSNRRLNVTIPFGDEHIVEDEVQNWRSVAPCKQ